MANAKERAKINYEEGRRRGSSLLLMSREYSVAWMMKSKANLVAVADVVGHVPKEISRFVYFFSKTEVALTQQLNRKS